MTIILHIGVHKTGTSALQSFLHRNSALLADRGVIYKPTIPDWPNHNPLAMAFMPGSIDHGPTRLAMTLAEAENKTVLISSEMLCEPEVDFDLLLSCLKGHDVRVIAYVRHPSDIVVSAFNEVVRHHDRHWTRPLNEEPFAYDPSQLDLLRPWLKIPNITLAPYDRSQWVGGSIFSDFLAMIGVSGDSFDFSQTGGNESLSYPLIEALRHVNIACPSADQHRAILELLQTIKCGPGEYPLTRKNVRKCIKRMRLALPSYRPHFRSGFDEGYLLEPRHEPEGGWFSLRGSAIARATGFLVKAATFLFPALDAGLM
ncbi:MULTISPECIES: sulfotransferase domain-containing protein [unclassified Mesorhizobium]|uniref:sulfotransferase domain-containing protein n=1 Tax=unclassified Mesorhizobium TaxID=325217 RepID=UPI0016766805|nr:MULTISPECIES: sulfotransferase domain-containing protein [unclassified Mesorhizobium]